jgi:hypothetical protein
VVHIRPDEVVASALAASDAGVRDADNAAQHGVALKTIRRWRRLYQRRGLPRGQKHLTSRCPVCDDAPLDEPAFAALFGWYLATATSARSDETFTACTFSTTRDTYASLRRSST